MQFERDPESPHLASITFENNEKAILDQSLLLALGRASTAGNTQLSDRNASVSTKLLEAGRNHSQPIRGFDANILRFLATRVHEIIPGLKDDVVAEAGGMEAMFSRIAGVLGTDPTTTPSSEDIDKILGDITIPDSLEGLDG